jgi:hypothetical protein
MTPQNRSGLLAGSLLAASLAAAERWTRATRATDIERLGPMVGDEAIPKPDWDATRAITIEAPPHRVWPWIVQMGFPKYRAGWYAPYYLDRIVWRVKERSAEVIRPDLQHLEVGDRVPDSPDWSTYFTVTDVEPERHLVMRSTTHLLPPYEDLIFVWAFELRGRDDGQRTRVVMRARTSFTPVWPRLAMWLFLRLAMDPGDIVEAGSMLHGIKRRVERSDSTRTPQLGAPRARAAQRFKTMSRR